MSENTLVTAGTFSFPHEAEIARSTLEAEGIAAYVADAHTINMQWLYSNAMGGVRVQVHQKDLTVAKEVLNTDYSSLVDSEVGVEINEKCSKCGGLLEPYTKGRRPAYIVFLLLGFPLFFHQHGSRCASCGDFTKT